MISALENTKKEEISENYKSNADTELRLSELIVIEKNNLLKEDTKMKIKSL